MPMISVNGVHLHVVDTGGAGEVVLFSHGLLWSHRLYGPQIALLRSVYRCIAYDHRGQGDSEVPPGRGPVTIEDCYADAVALIEHLGVGPVHFVGLSMGGFVGIRLAARRPDLVKSLILLETAADPEPREHLPRYGLLNAVARLGLLPLVAGRVMQIMFGTSFLEDPERAADRATWKGELLRNKRTIHRAVKGVLTREGVEHELVNIVAPTLVIRGDEDRAIALARMEALAAGIQGARFVRLVRGGHSCTVEEPALVNEAIEAFLLEHAGVG